MWTSFQCLFVEHVSAPAFLIAAGKYQVANDSWVGKKCKSKANSMKLQCKIQIKKFFFFPSLGGENVQRGIKDYTAKLRSDSEEDTWSNVLFALLLLNFAFLSLFFSTVFQSRRLCQLQQKKRRLKCSNIFHFTSNSWSNNNHNNLEIENLLSCFDCVRRYYCSVDLKWRFYLRFFLLSSNPDSCMSLNIYGSQY